MRYEWCNQACEILSSERSRLYAFKCDVTSIFEDMGGFLLSTSDQLSSFQKIMTPYVDYFYPTDETLDESFLREVVDPCENEILSAIDEALCISDEDETVYRQLADEIAKVLGIRKNVERILGVVEAIEIYSINTILIATRGGSEGYALSRISEEMGKLSHRANEISETWRRELDELEEMSRSFGAQCERLVGLSKESLSRIRFASSTVFDDIRNTLNDQSFKAHEILGYADEIGLSIGSILNSLQIEDIVRQDIDKVMSLTEELETFQDGESASGSPVDDEGRRLLKVFVAIAMSKLEAIRENLIPLIDGTEECCDGIAQTMNKFTFHLYRSGVSDDAERGGETLDVYAKLEKLKGESLELIEEIINGKRDVYEVSNRIGATMQRFEKHFSELMSIAKRFETVNIITRIELAKHPDLRRSMETALTDVWKLPSAMKILLENALEQHQKVSRNIVESITLFGSSSQRQQDRLRNCMSSIKRISVKLSESKKYYGDISEEIGDICSRIMGYLQGGRERLENIRDSMRVLTNTTEQLQAEEGERESGSAFSLERDDADLFEKYLQHAVIEESRRKILESAISDMLTLSARQEVRIF